MIMLGLLGLILVSGHIVNAEDTLTLEGEVMKKNDDALPSVLVRAYRESSMVDDDSTDKKGKYSIEYKKGSPIDTVRYERTGYIPGTVEDLSGITNHTISKILYQVGSKLSTFQAQEALSALERIYLLDRANDVSVDQLQKEYTPVIEKMVVPQELDAKLKAVRALYKLQQ